MTREEKVALCRRLKNEGLTVSQISERTGIARSTVGDYLLGDEHNREVARARCAPCSRCGSPRRKVHPGLCGSCIHEDSVRGALEVVRLWGEGKTHGEIAAHLGVSKGAARRRIFIYREQGYDLPYRRTGEALENIRRANCRPEQVAA